MRGIRYERFGDYSELALVELPDPHPGKGTAVVRMTVAGVTPLDNSIRAGHRAPERHKPLPIVPGGVGVGRVDDPGTTGLPEGTRVLIAGPDYGTLQDGTWREYLEVDPARLLPLPDDVSDLDVAALATGAGYLTAYLALTELVSFQPGQSVLAPGIGGSVGFGGVEVARALGAGTAISTASTTEKAVLGRKAGYDVIDLSQESLRDGLARLTDGRGVDVVLDGIGGSLTGEALGSLARNGTLVSIGYSGGTLASINVTDLIWKALHVQGFHFAVFSPAVLGAAVTTLLNWLAAGTINPTIGTVFPLEQAAEAQRHLIEDRPFGRVLLTFAAPGQ